MVDGVGLSAPETTQLRMAARGIGLGPLAASASFVVDNTAANTPPAVQLVPLSAAQSGAVVINMLLSDPEGDPVDLSMELSHDGSSWVSARPGAGGDGTVGLDTAAGAGSLHTFIWDSAAPTLGGDGAPLVDGNGLWLASEATVGVIEESVLLRVTPPQSGGAPALAGTPDTLTLTVDNGLTLNAPPQVDSLIARRWGPAWAAGRRRPRWRRR